VFIQLDAGRQSLASVRSTLGVASVVRFGSQPTVVPNVIVDALMANADPESGLHRLGQCRPFEPGSRVSVIAGPFDGLEGVFDREIGAERVVILLRVLGQETAVRVPSQYVVPTALRR
jgi:transcriptional antiterminator RfaH